MKWTSEEVETLKKYYNETHIDKLCSILNRRTKKAIRLKAFLLEITDKKYKLIDERFWGYTDKKSKNECWNWTGYIETNGYGRFAFNYKGRRYKVGAHRLSYIINNNKIPGKLCVCHTCDNPKCVNPDHLFLATQYENMHDMIDKNRKRVGVQCSHANFNQKQIDNIRDQHQRGQSIRSIARKYQVYHSTISRIVNYQTYKEII